MMGPGMKSKARTHTIITRTVKKPSGERTDRGHIVYFVGALEGFKIMTITTDLNLTIGVCAFYGSVCTLLL